MIDMNIFSLDKTSVEKVAQTMVKIKPEWWDLEGAVNQLSNGTGWYAVNSNQEVSGWLLCKAYKLYKTVEIECLGYDDNGCLKIGLELQPLVECCECWARENGYINIRFIIGSYNLSCHGKKIDYVWKELKDLNSYNREDYNWFISMVKLEFAAPDGKIIERTVEGVEYIPPNGNSKEPDKLYDTAIIEDGKTAYIKVSSFDSFYVDKDRKGILKFYEQIKDYKNLIIDIRGNGGGSENYYTEDLVPPLLDKSLEAKDYMVFRKGDYIKPFLRSRFISGKSVEDLPAGLNYPGEVKKDFSVFTSSTRKISSKNPVGFKGRIFLLVDSYVYSSAESFTVFAKSTGFATIVGTWTGGDGIGIDPGVVSLPNSGLIVRFPLEMGLNPDGTSNEETHTAPDIYAEETYGDFIKYNEYKSGLINPYDTVLNKVLEMTK